MSWVQFLLLLLLEISSPVWYPNEQVLFYFAVNMSLMRYKSRAIISRTIFLYTAFCSKHLRAIKCFILPVVLDAFYPSCYHNTCSNSNWTNVSGDLKIKSKALDFTCINCQPLAFMFIWSLRNKNNEEYRIKTNNFLFFQFTIFIKVQKSLKLVLLIILASIIYYSITSFPKEYKEF